MSVASPELLGALTVEQVLDAVAIRIDGPRAWDEALSVALVFSDLGRTHRAVLRNGVLTHRVVGEGDDAPVDLTLTLTKDQLLPLLIGAGLDGIGTDGDVGVLARLVAVVEFGDRNFPIVTP